MSPELMIKLFFSSLISLMFAYLVFSRYDAEVGSEHIEQSQRYQAYIPGCFLPAFLAALIGLTIYMHGSEMTFQLSLSMYFSIFIHISMFYTLLIVLLPVLRKHISARAIAFLWMIPNYLYITEYSFMDSEQPLFVMHLPEKLVWQVFVVTIITASAIILWKILSHLIFRHQILKGSVSVSDTSVLEVWNSEIKRANIKKPKFKLVISSAVNTPLSIGLFEHTTKVVLPDKKYTADELLLIFRHEIIHICRKDAWSKFFLIFCTALCWYNPLMWIAMRKCSEDLELSCDETVLIDADDASRKKYASLILDTVTDERGFTTCLSASASALRYRIKNIMKPKKQSTGAIIVGLLFFVLCMSSGTIALAYGEKTGAEIIYNSQNTSEYSIEHIRLDEDPYNTIIEIVDSNAFHTYMSSLKMSTITGNYTFKEDDKRYTFIYNTPEGILSVVLSEEAVKIVPLHKGKATSSYYYLADKVDWDYLESIVVSYPALNVH